MNIQLQNFKPRGVIIRFELKQQQWTQSGELLGDPGGVIQLMFHYWSQLMLVRSGGGGGGIIGISLRSDRYLRYIWGAE